MTSKLLTSGNFYLNILHNKKLFSFREYLNKIRDSFDNNILSEVLNFIMDETLKLYIDKLGNTPFLGLDFNGENIYSLKENEAVC